MTTDKPKEGGAHDRQVGSTLKSRMKPQDMASIISAFARAGVYHEKLCLGVLEAYQQQEESVSARFSTVDLSVFLNGLVFFHTEADRILRKQSAKQVFEKSVCRRQVEF